MFIHSYFCSFIYLLIGSFLCLFFVFIYWFVRSMICLFDDLLIHLFIPSFIFIYLFLHFLFGSFICFSVNWFIHLFNDLFLRSLIDSFIDSSNHDSVHLFYIHLSIHLFILFIISLLIIVLILHLGLNNFESSVTLSLCYLINNEYSLLWKRSALRLVSSKKPAVNWPWRWLQTGIVSGPKLNPSRASLVLLPMKTKNARTCSSMLVKLLMLLNCR